MAAEAMPWKEDGGRYNMYGLNCFFNNLTTTTNNKFANFKLKNPKINQ